MRADGQTHMTKPIVASRNSVNASKKKAAALSVTLVHLYQNIKRHARKVTNLTSYYNIYAVQQETQCGLNGKFYSALKLARHVSDLIGPSSGAFCTSFIRRLWYVVIRVE